MKTAATLVDVITVIACILGGLQIFSAITAADANAMQVASGVVVGIGVAAVPYMLAGALHRVTVRELMAAEDRRGD